MKPIEEELQLLELGGAELLPSPDTPGMISFVREDYICISEHPVIHGEVSHVIRKSDLIGVIILKEGEFLPNQGEIVLGTEAIDRIQGHGSLRGFALAKPETQLLLRVSIGTTVENRMQAFDELVQQSGGWIGQRTEYPDGEY